MYYKCLRPVVTQQDVRAFLCSCCHCVLPVGRTDAGILGDKRWCTRLNGHPEFYSTSRSTGVRTLSRAMLLLPYAIRTAVGQFQQPLAPTAE
jgi:hypothetical protein